VDTTLEEHRIADVAMLERLKSSLNKKA